MSAPPPAQRFSTRVLLVCAALAGAHVLLHLATLPLLTTLAPTAPPVYAVIAGAHSIMPFLARRLTGVPGSAIVASAIAAALVSTTSPSGIVAGVPVLLAGCTIDLVLGRRASLRATSERRYFAAGAVAAVALFAVSLAVFSPGHLTPPILIGTAVGRVVGEAIAVVVSRVLAAGLVRAGVGRAVRTRDQSSPAS